MVGDKGQYPTTHSDGQRLEAEAAERFADLVRAHGEPFAGGGNRPVYLDDADSLWYVSAGSVNVFVAREQDGEFVELKHLLRAGRGRLLFTVHGCLNRLVAKGLPNSELLRVPRDILLTSAEDGAIAGQVDLWVGEIAAALAEDVTYRPHIEHFLFADASVEVTQGAAVSTKGGVVWTSGGDEAPAFLGTEEASQSGSGFVPVAPGSWVSVHGEARLQGKSSMELRRAGVLSDALSEFHQIALSADDMNRRVLLADAVNLRAAQSRYRQESELAARQSLLDAVAVDGGRQKRSDDALQAALELIGRHEGIRFQKPRPQPYQRGTPDISQLLNETLSASGVRSRVISLGVDERWWLGDSGAMLALRHEDGQPVALLPSRMGRYRIVDPISGRSVPVTASRAETLEPQATFFYQSLPHSETSDAGALARIAFYRWRGDVLSFVSAGLLAGLALLVPAILLGIFADEVLPTGRTGLLIWLTVGMLLLALAAALLKILEGTALMRLEGRGAARLTAALWDRLLELPALFFRKYTSGDLATRAMAFQGLRDKVSGIIMQALLSTLFLLPTFALLFIYNTSIGWIGLAGGLVVLTVTVTLGVLQVPHHRRLRAAQRSLAGVLLQLIGAAYKLRATGKEWTAFTQWARGYREQTSAEMDVGALNEYLVAFTATAPLLATAALFGAAAAIGPEQLSIGVFLTIYAAYMVFMAALAALGQATSGVAAIVPAVEEVTPILEAAPRGESTGDAVPELRGGVRLDNVSFRYNEDSPMVLHDVSIDVRPGEFVALVGGSGAGKSTLFRIILGLETPISGAIYFDGRDLESVNHRELRKQIGVVVQDGSLRPRTVSDNIIGASTDLSLDDAWHAARLAAVEKDIRAMSMGMFTVVTENSSIFSGGQIQRILLAAALARRPRLLLLDEATSWLDNKTQASVMKQIEGLAVTRIVIAHRLSTIRLADRIYVLEEGQVKQQGTFAELMETPGPFRDLAERQIA